MGEISQFIVSFWCVPVILFVVLPLLVGCFWVLSHVFDVLKPIAGQGKKPAKFSPPVLKHHDVPTA